MSVEDDWPTLPLPALRVVGERVTLRPWGLEDAEALASAWADPELRRRLDPPVGGVDAARGWIAGCGDRLVAGTAVDAAVVVDGAIVGEIGFHGWDRARQGALVGYWIAAPHRGRGLATSALATASAWWFDTLGGRVLLARCAIDNVASWRAAEAAGYSLLAARDGERIMVQRSGAATARQTP